MPLRFFNTYFFNVPLDFRHVTKGAGDGRILIICRGGNRTHEPSARLEIVDDHMDGHGEQPGPAREGARGAQRTYRGGPEEGHRGGAAFLAADVT